MADFTVDVPISVKGGASVAGGKGAAGGGGAAQREQEKTNKLLKKLDKSIIATFDPLEILTSAFKDLIQLFQPLIKILSLLFLVIFLPLMPLLMLLVKAIAMFVKLLSGGFGGIGEFIGKIILGILLVALAAFLSPLVAGAAGIAALVLIVIAAAALLGDALEDAFKFIIENIGKMGEFLANLGVRIWEFIKFGLAFIGDLGVKIWDFILSGLSSISDLGKMIWEFLKKGLSGIGSLIAQGFKAIINGAIKFANAFLPSFAKIPRLAEGGIVNKPTLALIGEAGPEAVVPLSKMGKMGNITININKPTLRNESDIKHLANEVGRALQRQTNGRFSSK